jgi:hypothetical protein
MVDSFACPGSRCHHVKSQQCKEKGDRVDDPQRRIDGMWDNLEFMSLSDDAVTQRQSSLNLRQCGLTGGEDVGCISRRFPWKYDVCLGLTSTPVLAINAL